MTPERKQQVEGFLASEGWGEATRAPLAGDASNRRYERLTGGPDGRGAVLMDAPTASQMETDAFLRVAGHLTKIGLSAPRVLATDEIHGLMLLEDLGDGLFARLIDTESSREEKLYLAATDLLSALHSHPTPAAPDYGVTTMTEAIAPVFDWYGFGATGGEDRAGKAASQTRLAEAFRALTPWVPVLALRDYHSENLFWLPDREGVARVGVIDFQDAVLSHPAYDLISLAHDVRRDVGPRTVHAVMSRFSEATGQPFDDLARAAATLSAQRNLRILGVFARLSMHHGKTKYLDLLPRTWARLNDALSHPDLDKLRETVLASLPAPDPETLDLLRTKCTPIQTP